MGAGIKKQDVTFQIGRKEALWNCILRRRIRALQFARPNETIQLKEQNERMKKKIRRQKMENGNKTEENKYTFWLQNDKL